VRGGAPIRRVASHRVVIISNKVQILISQSTPKKLYFPAPVSGAFRPPTPVTLSNKKYVLNN
jgi:hypothetical protein